MAQRVLVPWRSKSGRDADVTVTGTQELVPSGA
jgi:hypothetical protein